MAAELDWFPEWTKALELAALYEKLKLRLATREDALRARGLLDDKALSNRLIDHAIKRHNHDNKRHALAFP